MAATITTQKIQLPYPGSAEPELILTTGPCRVRFGTTDEDLWVTGTYDDPSGVLPLEVTSGDRTAITQRFEPTLFSGAAMPRLELSFGKSRPFALEVRAGASENVFDLGGLPLSRVVVKVGAGRFDLDWSAPNPGTLSLIDISAGAGAITARRLANANFATLRFGGGMAACTFDFGGALRRDARVRIDSGLGSVDITVPSATAATVRAKAFAAARRATGTFTVRGDEYLTQPAADGVHPLLEIDVSLAFGALNLATT
ncbi:MAG TPA: hypothetical protein VEU77_04145 [Candidatus Acidoferrales bacterium]|nr:hypothetical protein [Candidatus Acidoferrales bacterium]